MFTKTCKKTKYKNFTKICNELINQTRYILADGLIIITASNYLLFKIKFYYIMCSIEIIYERWLNVIV